MRRKSVHGWVLSAVLAAGLVANAGVARAAPRIPQSDDEVVETLALRGPWRSRMQHLRARLAEHPEDAGAALELARADLEQARRLGDARYAGWAEAALAGWRAPERDPVDVVVMQATIAQYLHRFDEAERLLLSALQRAPGDSQAWLTLATVRRVGGRLDASEAACRELLNGEAKLHGVACLAENRALRGQRAEAARTLAGLLGRPEAQPLRGWLLATLGLVRELDGDRIGAERCYRAALAIAPDLYVRLALSDLLLEQDRPAEAWQLLAEQPASDAVLLRRALAARALGREDAVALAAELGERFAATAQRGDGNPGHLREQARWALELRDDPREALRLARLNLALQREPADLLLFRRAAVAAGDRAALAELAKLMSGMGVSDARMA